MLQLHSTNLTLRDFTSADEAAYCALRRDEKFQRFYPDEQCTDAFSQYLLQMFIAQAAELPRTRFQLAIVDNNTDTVIGSCGLRIEGAGVASVGCELSRHWHTKGYAREAAATLLAFGFGQLTLTAVYADTKAQNLAAIRLCRSLGFCHATPAEQTSAQSSQVPPAVRLHLTAAYWHLHQQHTANSPRAEFSVV